MASSTFNYTGNTKPLFRIYGTTTSKVYEFMGVCYLRGCLWVADGGPPQVRSRLMIDWLKLFQDSWEQRRNRGVAVTEQI